MKVKITFLVENTVPTPGWKGEYGFSALVTVDDKSYLFDTGSFDALFANAAMAGLDISNIEGIIISHGHFDHTGGVIKALQLTKNKTVYAHPNIFAERYVDMEGNYKSIGCVASHQEIEAMGGKLIFVDEFTEIGPNVFLTGFIPRLNDFEDAGGNFKVKDGDKYIDDVIADDMSLVIDHPEGLIVLSGCAHAGVINTLEHVRKHMGNKKILAFLGGTHLINADENRINKTINALEKLDIGQLVLAHCTGFYAAAKLYNRFSEKVIKGETGMTFEY